jgi:hypothetical protein
MTAQTATVLIPLRIECPSAGSRAGFSHNEIGAEEN